MRFRAEQHLRRPSEIRAVREHGRRIDCREFILWWKSRDSSAASSGLRPGVKTSPSGRVCVIASGAAVGSATRRNRAKRRLREVFRQQQQHVPVHCELLLIARRTAGDCPMPELQQKFVEACTRIPRPTANA